MLRFLQDQRGSAASEYALILAIVGTGIAMAALGLSSSVGGAILAMAGRLG